MANDAHERRAGSRLAAAVTLPPVAFAVAACALLAWAVADALDNRELAARGIDGAAHAEIVSWRWVAVIAIGALLTLAVLGHLVLAARRDLLAAAEGLRRDALALADDIPVTFERLRTGNGEPPAGAPPAPPAGEFADARMALEAVRDSVVALALRQARSRRTVNGIFTNLARRSQILVERQLRLLDEMERDERDPDRLAALFKLDHLSARLRRNDENLLVLAGAEPRRRWREGVPLAALALAALSEIEQYERVRADVDDSLYIAGHAAADIGHLLAELLDNATAFSNPNTAVRVAAHARPDGALVEIVDDGIGLSERALAEANAMLAVPAEVDVAVSERMGLVVVSHLAARHGVRVGLTLCPDGGVRAAVELPAALLTEPAEADLPAPPPAAVAPRVQPSHAPPPIALPPGAVPDRTQPAATAPQLMPRRRREPDPAATAATLTRLYEGVRRGQAGDGAAAPTTAPDDIEGEQ
ncbi:sensor histidine kinase [Catellatospora methionotrophica]|uniref:sensor histidine kinase n=1 Tax=Catellatospora methionotrophica TaxID=121620 RepID=UPI0033FE1FFE